MTPQEAIDTLLATRGPGKTICPSEAARLLADGMEWRARMPQIHDAARHLSIQGAVELSWRGKPRDGADGPYRIGLPAKSPS